MPKLAPQMRVAFANIASKTGCKSPGEPEMTCSTSEVAVCCSSDSVSSRARLHLIEQAHILDRDHRLVGEGPDQLNLLVGERLNGPSYERNHAKRISFALQRNSKGGPITELLLHVQIRVLRVCKNVGHMNGLCCQHRSSDDASSPAFVWDGLYIFNDIRRVAVGRG